MDIIGKGTGQTTITSPGGFGTTTFAIGEGSSTVSALSIQIPGGGNNTGLALVGDANGIVVTEQGGDFGHVGVDLQNSGASLNGSTVTMTAGTAARSFSGGTVRDSRLSGSGGFSGIGTIRRSRITAGNTAVGFDGGSTIENTVIRPQSGSGTFVGVLAFSGTSSFSVDLRNVTIAGEGIAGTTGVTSISSQSFGPAPAVSAAVTNTIIRGMGTDLRTDVNDGPQAGTPTAQISIQSSIFDPAKANTSSAARSSPAPATSTPTRSSPTPPVAISPSRRVRRRWIAVTTGSRPAGPTSPARSASWTATGTARPSWTWALSSSAARPRSRR